MASWHHLPKTLFSAYGLYSASRSISRLRQYEAKMETAAEYSSTAARQLHDTRTTQGSAVVAFLTSLTTSLYLSTAAAPGPSVSVTVALSVLNIGVDLLASGYMESFWRKKAAVPGLTGYNEAVERTRGMVGQLRVLAAAWGVSLVVGLW